MKTSRGSLVDERMATVGTLEERWAPPFRAQRRFVNLSDELERNPLVQDVSYPDITLYLKLLSLGKIETNRPLRGNPLEGKKVCLIVTQFAQKDGTILSCLVPSPFSPGTALHLPFGRCGARGRMFS